MQCVNYINLFEITNRKTAKDTKTGEAKKSVKKYVSIRAIK